MAEMAGVHQSSLSPPILRRQDWRAVSGWGLAVRRGHITGLHPWKVRGSGVSHMQFKALQRQYAASILASPFTDWFQMMTNFEGWLHHKMEGAKVPKSTRSGEGPW